MKTSLCARMITVVLLLLGGSLLTARAEIETLARIKNVRIERTNLVVEVEVSGPVAKVTLESSQRLGRRAWEPRAVRLMEAGPDEAANFTFTVPITPKIEIVRVRADLQRETLPASFYTGETNFVAVNSGPPGDAEAVFGAPSVDRSNDGATAPRDVVESDIWRLVGDTLYFFNQYRGLQVIDVSNPDLPAVLGTYDLVAAGEQMYVIEPNKVVLLARDNCAWYGSSAEGRVILLEIKDGQPELVKELPVKGSITESRMVGSALYVVANSYQTRVVPARDDSGATFEQWEWGSSVVSFDLADFASAREKSSDWVGGYGNVIYATDQFLFVSQTIYNYEQRQAPTSHLHCYDISSPDGTFAKQSTFSAGGVVRDKFKMYLNGDTFAVVVQVDPFFGGTRSTWVNTFSLENPQKPSELGRLKIIENEQLFATRFHGDLLYAVTYFLIDPLWVIDMSEPENPRRVGELHIPGWSTYLQPIGDKLLAIGTDDTDNSRRTAVQLFDVSNPADPTLLSKVVIGDGWSGSEANWDEKAFGVLPEDNLVLVPFQSSGKDTFVQGVQIIDLETDRLVKRGVIAQNMGARRATLHRERILSISSRELLTVNATDRDNPQVVRSTLLSWAAERVHLAGDYVVEVDASTGDEVALRVVHADDPSAILNSVALGKLPYMGSIELGQKLYVLQGKSMQLIYPEEWTPTNYKPIATNPAVMTVTVLDLSALPELPVTAESEKTGSTNQFYGQYGGLVVSDGLIVWASKNHGWFWGWRGGLELDARAGGVAGSLFAPDAFWPGWGGGAGHFIAVKVDQAEPQFASEVMLTSTNGWWNFSDSFTAGGLVFTSHQTSEYDPDFDPPPQTWQCYDGNQFTTCTNDPPPGMWVQRYYLDVIDFNDPEDPLVRKPVNIPGSLIGIDRGGELLFTRGYDLTGVRFYTGDESVSASAYDGVQAHLMARLLLPAQWPRPTLSDKGFLYLGNPPTTNSDPALQVWALDQDGKFQLVSTKVLESPAQELEKIGDMLVVQSHEIQLFDATNPSDIVQVGGGKVNTCYGVLLQSSDGDLNRGLWVPVGWYGVIRIPVGSE